SLHPRRRAPGRGARRAGVVMARPSPALQARGLHAAPKPPPPREAAAPFTRAAKKHRQPAVLFCGGRPPLLPRERTSRRPRGRAGLARQSQNAWRRVIVEKPFGHDFASAEALNAQILKVLSEDQVYRIDHFLGKETVQNILVLRFANGIFEPLWTRDHVDHV